MLLWGKSERGFRCCTQNWLPENFQLSLISPEIIDGATGAPEHAMKMQKQITFMTQHTHKHTHE